MQLGRRIAFDYGQVRIGVAVSDASGLLATPVATLKSQDPDLKDALRSLFTEYEPIYVVIGEPKHLSGAQSAAQIGPREFGDLIGSMIDIPIYFIDERMSTVSAARNLRESGFNAKSSKDKIDAMAAVMILESALDKERIAGRVE